MSPVEFSIQRRESRSARSFFRRSAVNAAILSVTAGIGCAAAATPATVSRSVVVQGDQAAVWALIGPFCAIRGWLPPVGTCSEDGATPPTRTLVTKDGKATFVERQTARSDDRHFYSYTFISSPLPVTHYNSTIKVTALSHGHSRVTWRGTYLPVAGQERIARDALDGIYAAGLDSIRTQTAERFKAVALNGVAP
jgi:hypothetical protein